jgi:hypothetical protein
LTPSSKNNPAVVIRAAHHGAASEMLPGTELAWLTIAERAGETDKPVDVHSGKKHVDFIIDTLLPDDIIKLGLASDV